MPKEIGAMQKDYTEMQWRFYRRKTKRLRDCYWSSLFGKRIYKYCI